MATAGTRRRRTPSTDTEDGTIVPVPQWGAVAPDDDPETPEESAADRVARMLESVDSERSKVSIYRKDKFTKEQSWCEDMTPQEFERGGLDMIRGKWGPGAYVIRLLTLRPGAQPGRGMSGYLPVTVLHIALDPVPSTASTAAPGDALARVLEAMQANQQAFQQQVLQVLGERPAPVDPMTQMQTMLTMMTTMREAMGLNAQPQARSSVSEIVEAIKELKGAAELIGDKEPPETVAGMLPSVLETVRALATQPRQPAVPALPAQPFPTIALPQAVATNPAPPAQAQPDTGDEDMNLAQLAALAQLKKALQPLFDMSVEHAQLAALVPEDAGDEDPRAQAADAVLDKAIDYVCDTLPEDVAAELHGEQWLQLLVQFVPEAAQHAEFLTLVRDEYVALPEDEPVPADSPAQSA